MVMPSGGTMQEIIELKYLGRVLDKEEGMDAYDVAEAIDGFADFVITLAHAVYGTDTPTRLNIRGVPKGSLDIQFVLDTMGVAMPLLGHVGGLLGAVNQSIALLKHLKGSQPKTATHVDGGSVQVENNDGQITVVNGDIYNVVLTSDLGKQTEQFLGRPLHKTADAVEVRVASQIAAIANRNNADSFVSLGKGEPLATHTSETYLTIQTVVLEGDGLWRFSDGRNKFRAAINDAVFLKRVSSGSERFGRGDILRVKLRSVQEKIKGELRTTHTVEQVLEHQPYSGGQSTLF